MQSFQSIYLSNDVESVYDKFDEFTFSEQPVDTTFVLFNGFRSKLQNGNRTVCTAKQFETNFDTATQNMFACMDWNNMIVAGGSVLAMLTADMSLDQVELEKWFNDPASFGDIDIFLYGLTSRQATKKLYEIYENIKKVMKCDVNCIRGPRAITFVSQYPYRHVQVILKTFSSVAEILNSFDIDCCGFGYDGNKVWCTSRSKHSINTRSNIIDLRFRSSSYEYRLAKYGRRGYIVPVPHFDETMLNEQIYFKSPHQLKGLAKLIVLEKLNNNVKLQIYRDILDSHQASMRRNITFSATYEESNYSKIVLPWNEKATFATIKATMDAKHDKLNKTSTDKKFMCYIGTLNDVVVGTATKLPNFASETAKQNYYATYVFGRLQWYDSDDAKLFGKFEMFDDDTEWYATACNNLNKRNIIDMILGQNVEEVESYLLDPSVVSLSLDETESENLSDKLVAWKMSVLNSRDIVNRNPLQTAIYSNNVNMVTMLLKHGANPLFVSKLGRTALHTACETGNLEMVELLYSVIDKTKLLRDSYGLTPILYALIYGHYDVFTYLYQHVSAPILYALNYGHDVFTYLYQHVSAQNLIWSFKLNKSLSYYPLELCLLFRQYTIAEFLLKSNYDYDDQYYTRTNKSSEAVHVLKKALTLCDAEMFDLLVKYSYKSKKYSMTSLASQTTNILIKYSKSHNDENKKYYLNLAMKLYSVHMDKKYLYAIVKAVINNCDFDNFVYVVRKYNVNLHMNVKNQSFVDVANYVLEKITTDEKNNVSETKSVVPKQRFVLETSSFAYDDQYLYPHWIMLYEMNKSVKNETVSKPSVSVPMQNNTKKVNDVTKIIQYLTTHCVVVNIAKKVDNAEKPNVIKTSCTDSNITRVTVSVVDNKNAPVSDQIKYIKLYDAIKNGDTLSSYYLNTYNLCCKMLKSELTLVKTAIMYGNVEALKAIVTRYTANVPQIKKQDDEPIYTYCFSHNDWLTIFNDICELEHPEDMWQTYLNLLELDIGITPCTFFKLKFNLMVNTVAIHQHYNLMNEMIKYFVRCRPYSKQELSCAVDALSRCINLKNTKMVKIFLTFGQEQWNATDEKSNYPFYASPHNFYNLLKSTRKLDSDTKNMLELLLSYDPNLCNKDDEGEDRFEETINVSSDHAQFLISHGLDLTKSFSNGFYSIHSALNTKIRFTHGINVLKQLLNASPTTTYFDQPSNGKLQTPLMVAIQNYHNEAIDLLLEMGASQTAKDDFGNTPLHYACITSNLYAVRKLKWHAEENYFRMTPADYVVNNMRSLFHHARNEKNKVSHDILSYMVEIYKKHVFGNSSVRVPTSYQIVSQVNKYILDNLPDNVKTVPPHLLIN